MENLEKKVYNALLLRKEVKNNLFFYNFFVVLEIKVNQIKNWGKKT